MTYIPAILQAACAAYEGDQTGWNDVIETERSVWIWNVEQFKKMSEPPLTERERMCYFIVKSLTI